MNRYPIFIPSKGRHEPTQAKTVRTLLADGVPFHLVVEPPEADAYAELLSGLGVIPRAHILQLPFHDLGQGSIPARNWIRERAERAGFPRHWQLDDNIEHFARVLGTRRIRCDAGAALAVCEDFTDRYENVAVSGLAYYHDVRPMQRPEVPFRLNCHVYSTLLVASGAGLEFRGRYNEDTDLCLQALAKGYCTVQVVAFMMRKAETMTMKGGNTDQLYDGDGRLAMARELERRWPGVVKVTRRWGRPQHVVDWTKFTTPLKRRPDFDPTAPPKDYGLVLRAVGEVKNPALRALVEQED